MSKIKVLKANKEHKEFIIHANKVSCATGDENKRMQRILKYYGANEINLKFYYKKI